MSSARFIIIDTPGDGEWRLVKLLRKRWWGWSRVNQWLYKPSWPMAKEGAVEQAQARLKIEQQARVPASIVHDTHPEATNGQLGLSNGQSRAGRLTLDGDQR